MARSEKADSAYNARRRFGRQAVRYLDKAKQVTGATAEKYRALAREAFDNAMATYDKNSNQKIASRLINVGAELGIDAQGERKRYVSAVGDARKQALIQSSSQALESAVNDPDERREREARILLSSTNVGHKIMAGLIDVWADAENREKAILDYFKADNLADVIEILEKKIGDALYKVDDVASTYSVVKLLIQNAVKDNSLVA